MAENGGGPLRSATITGLATARAMLRPLGFTRERLARPNIGVAHMWSETGPCNFSHRTVAGVGQGRHRGGRRDRL
jgi:dihydroxy-acid dehydratase